MHKRQANLLKYKFTTKYKLLQSRDQKHTKLKIYNNAILKTLQWGEHLCLYLSRTLYAHTDKMAIESPLWITEVWSTE